MNKYICPACGGVQYTKTDAVWDCMHCGNKKTEKVDITDDEEVYLKIRSLYFDENDCVGIFHRGHIDMGQWKRVATDYMKTELDIENTKYLEFRKGWYKVLPNRKMVLFDRKVRGSFPAMECVYCGREVSCGTMMPYKKKIDDFFGIPECCLMCEFLESTEPGFMSLKPVEYYCTLNIIFPTKKLTCKRFEINSMKKLSIRF